MAHAKFNRTPKQIEFDRNEAIRLWLGGARIREIASILEELHTQQGNPYKLSLMTIQRDIASIIKETRIQREKSGISSFEDALQKYDYLYNQAILSGDIKTAKLVEDSIIKLKGLITDKSEVTIKYDIDIE